MHIDLRQLRHFEAVYRLTSFVRAAAEQNVTQSALTKSIKGLELNIGEKLFDRTTHSVTSTQAGDSLIHHAMDVLNSVSVLQDQALSLKGVTSGDITIGAGPFPLQSLITQSLHQFNRLHPNIFVNIQLGQADDLLDKLVRRQLDLVICDVSKLTMAIQNHEINVDALPPEPVVLVHDKNHPIRLQKVTAKNLNRYAWAFPTASPYFQQQLQNKGQVSPLLKPRYRLEVTSACVAMTVGSEVLTAVPLSMAQTACKDGSLSYSYFATGAFTNDGIHRLKKKTMSPAVREFTKVIQQVATRLATS